MRDCFHVARMCAQNNFRFQLTFLPLTNMQMSVLLNEITLGQWSHPLYSRQIKKQCFALDASKFPDALLLSIPKEKTSASRLLFSVNNKRAFSSSIND